MSNNRAMHMYFFFPLHRPFLLLCLGASSTMLFLCDLALHTSNLNVCYMTQPQTLQAFNTKKSKQTLKIIYISAVYIHSKVHAQNLFHSSSIYSNITYTQQTNQYKLMTTTYESIEKNKAVEQKQCKHIWIIMLSGLYYVCVCLLGCCTCGYTGNMADCLL